MNIEILKNLRDNPARYPNRSSNKFENEGLTMEEIKVLEQTWNNGNLFPQALRELLFLAGKYCYVLDYNIHETQQEMQEELRDAMQFRGHSYSRQFYIIDNYGGDQFLFIYLDETMDDPKVYEYASDAIERERPIDRFIGFTISQLINSSIKEVREGRNPF